MWTGEGEGGCWCLIASGEPESWVWREQRAHYVIVDLFTIIILYFYKIFYLFTFLEAKLDLLEQK